MSDIRSEIDAVLERMPVSLLHRPALARASGPGAKSPSTMPSNFTGSAEGSAKIAPALVAVGIAAGGFAAGAGAQLASQALNKKGAPADEGALDAVEYHLSIAELRERAAALLDAGDARTAVDAIVAEVKGRKIAPAVAVGYFLAGAAAGAAAARSKSAAA